MVSTGAAVALAIAVWSALALTLGLLAWIRRVEKEQVHL